MGPWCRTSLSLDMLQFQLPVLSTEQQGDAGELSYSKQQGGMLQCHGAQNSKGMQGVFVSFQYSNISFSCWLYSVSRPSTRLPLLLEMHRICLLIFVYCFSEKNFNGGHAMNC